MKWKALHKSKEIIKGSLRVGTFHNTAEINGLFNLMIKYMALNYTQIQHNFRKENNLTLNEYVLCDMIFFLSKKSDSKVPGWCFMSKETMAKEIGLSKQSVITLIKKLCEMDFLEKQEVTGFVKTTSKWEFVYFTDGKESLPIEQKTFDFGKESLPHAGKESLPNNNNIYNNNNNNKEKEIISKNKESLKTKKQKEINSGAEKVLFVDSIWNDFEKLKTHLSSDKDFVENYAYTDLKFYIRRVDTWSENSQTKRTNRGWLMTIRDFIEKAKVNCELVKIAKSDKPKDDGKFYNP